MSTNNRELFSEWLKSKSVSKPPINLILLAFDEVSEFAVSRKLSKVCIWAISSQSDFKFVRVDFYNIKNKIYFGEMTFTSMSGIGKFEPEIENYNLGKSIICLK